jgi:glycosyltransferase involved in cell wall biosynthesis
MGPTDVSDTPRNLTTSRLAYNCEDVVNAATECSQERQQRIVCLTTRFSTGGAELNALLLAKEFIARGHKAEIWSLYRAGDLNVGDVPSRIMLGDKPKSPVSFLRMLARFNALIGAFRPDVILGFQPLANVVGSLGMIRRGRFVASQRNPAESQSGVLGRIEEVIGSTRLYTGNIAVSEAVLDSYSRHLAPYRQRMQVIHNGLPPLPDITDNKIAARQHLGLPLSVPLVGTIGRLHKQKNQLFLLQTLKHLPDVHLMIAGDGPDEGMLRDAASSISERVHFLGRIEGADVPRAYRALDLFLFPSIYEGFGRSLIEAMAMRVTLIANDIAITREVTGGMASLLSLDPLRWSQEIRRGLHNGLYDLESAHMRATSFSLDAMTNRYLEAVSG